MNMLKAATLQSKRKLTGASMAPISLLQDIQEESSDSISLPAARNHNHRRDPSKDGLMKDNAYAADYDHVLLKAESTSDSDEGDEESTLLHGNRFGFIPDPPAHHRSQSVPIANSGFHGQKACDLEAAGGHHNQPARANTVPLRPMPPASDYIASNQDGGFLDVVVNANPSFISHNSDSDSMPVPGKPNLHRHASMGSTTNGGNRPYKCFKAKHIFPRWMREVGAMCHPIRVARNCQDILVRSYFLWFGFPCFLLSYCLFYLLGNPEFDFLPGEQTLAWWLLFITRQTVTLGLARMTVFIFVDGFMLGTRLAVQTLGPLLTLTAATSKGWPLIMAFWGVYNLILLHGDNPFQQNWLYWTKIRLFNLHYDGTILNCSLHTRILLSAIIGGIAVSAKRTILALRFGRKQFGK